MRRLTAPGTPARRLPLAIAGAITLALPAVLAASPSTTAGTGAKTCVLRPGADCRGVRDRWTIEHHGNLRRIRFARSTIVGADFRGADLRGADFRGAVLRHVDLRGARLDRARFSSLPQRGRARAHQAAQPCFDGSCDVTVMTDVRANAAAMPMADMSCGQIYCLPATGVLFQNATFNGADLSGANLGGATVDEPVSLLLSVDTAPNFLDANLTGANLVNASLAGATAISANFTRADLTGANLSSANMSGANLQSANATRTNFSQAEFLYTNTNGVLWGDTTCPNGTLTNTGC